MKNKAIDSYRKNRRQLIFLEDYQKEATESTSENVAEYEKYLLSEVQIDTLLSTLTEGYQQVFKYKVFYELSYQEIAAIMGTSEANVRKKFERARKRVQQIIQRGSENDEFKEFQKSL